MKKIAKILSIVLCLAMIMSLATVAFAAEGTTATISFADTANRTEFSTEKQVWQQNGITVTNDKAASQTDVADYSAPARFYKDSNLTIAYPGMKSVVITCNSGKSNGPTDLQNSLKTEGAEVEISGMIVTINFAAAVDTVVFEALTGQVRVDEITVSTGAAEAPEKVEVEVITAPEAGVAYKFGMIQENVSATDVYYLTGAMNGYYMDTTTSFDDAVDVYLEATEGGYYLYTMVDGAKLYINMVVNGTYVNGAYEEAASTVYTYDTESNTLVATVNDAPYWFGTRNDKTYTTVGPVKTEYEGFYMQFYVEAATGDTVNPNNPPATGDAIVAVVGAMLISGVALVALPKKRQF